ncbi:MAG: Holliday junction resolvase RuvX [Candidatus Altimarinota bacterium]
MNYLAIDLGDKRCGLAYSNLGYIFTLPFVPRVEIVSKLKKIIIEKEISKIIIGMPYDLYGVEKKQLEKTKKFSEKLKGDFPQLEIIEVDERFTTFQSLDVLSQLGEKNISDKKDSLSAYFILETYLDKIKNSF